MRLQVQSGISDKQDKNEAMTTESFSHCVFQAYTNREN